MTRMQLVHAINSPIVPVFCVAVLFLLFGFDIWYRPQVGCIVFLVASLFLPDRNNAMFFVSRLMCVLLEDTLAGMNFVNRRCKFLLFDFKVNGYNHIIIIIFYCSYYCCYYLRCGDTVRRQCRQHCWGELQHLLANPNVLVGCRQQGHEGNKILLWHNPPGLNSRCWLTQVDLYNGHKTGGCYCCYYCYYLCVSID